MFDYSAYEAVLGAACRKVDADSQFRLSTINAVDSTVDTQARIQADIADIGRVFVALRNSLLSLQDKSLSRDLSAAPKPLDAEGKLERDLDQASHSVKELVEVLASAQQEALDAGLSGEHQEMVVAEYQRSIDGLKSQYNLMDEIRWLLMEHDADLSLETAEFTSSEELIAHLSRL